MYLSTNVSPEQLRQAEQVRRNRQDIIKALSRGLASRRDSFKCGLFAVGGVITITMHFRDWVDMFMAHCNNAVLNPLPTPIPKLTGVDFLPPTDRSPNAG